MNVELNDSLKIQAVKEHSSVSEILSKLAKEYLEKKQNSSYELSSGAYIPPLK